MNSSASTMKQEPRRRQCFITTDKFVKGKGYVIGIVTEGVSGYAPTGGNGTAPYIWSADRKESDNICARKNKSVYGLCSKEVLTIISSSMRG